ncbi:hypothetical protein [Desulfosporosinus sp. OT]|uniref:hypothetical protein n=1 Tax=Desulfosporosinus sp. OT TaxID=913865 RepID=UPI000223A4D7|nr:hypothetical protein [Desulfosporosinus sp. OT]EGW37073.1 hypothetical protein DOT_4973 [Desulfosporosinus sp. OT]
MSRKPQEITVNLTVKFVPHPNPERGIDLLARLVLKQILKEEAENGRLHKQAIV